MPVKGHRVNLIADLLFLLRLEYLQEAETTAVPETTKLCTGGMTQCMGSKVCGVSWTLSCQIKRSYLADFKSDIRNLIIHGTLMTPKLALVPAASLLRRLAEDEEKVYQSMILQYLEDDQPQTDRLALLYFMAYKSRGASLPPTDIMTILRKNVPLYVKAAEFTVLLDLAPAASNKAAYVAAATLFAVFSASVYSQNLSYADLVPYLPTLSAGLGFFTGSRTTLSPYQFTAMMAQLSTVFYAYKIL